MDPIPGPTGYEQQLEKNSPTLPAQSARQIMPDLSTLHFVRDDVKELLRQLGEVDAIHDDIMFWTTTDLSALIVCAGILAGKIQRITNLFTIYENLGGKNEDFSS